jgi:F0F1-type ATP synthase membrane subunit b/b'
MDKTLHDLGRIVLYGLPTSFLVILLCIYLKVMYFTPFKKMLAARYEATEGARKAAEESLARAHAKAAEFDAALQRARQEIYAEQEQYLKKLHDQQAAEAEAARRAAEERLNQARQQLAAEAAAARKSLAAQSDLLASQIVDAILSGRAAT